ncbi:hypothetical protein HHI36_021897 [Cryptolaemus montrouzieri]|uniref:Reverse transcriptase n=1 Tax=Cryptolaemus montrouzieri TaxID=559131 RepID=A0ABD2MY96_9CUCU
MGNITIDCLNDCLSILFAEDAVVSVECENLDVALGLGGRVRERASEWFSGNGLSMSVDRTKEVVFSLRPTDCSTVGFLGLHLDTHLTWSVHIDHLSSKLSRNIYVLRNLSISRFARPI